MMIHRIDETVPMNELPTWLQELWELDSALARRAEKHYLELKQVKNIAYEPVLAAALTAEDIEQAADKLTDEERHDLIHRYCHGCGSLDTSCRCWDDS